MPLESYESIHGVIRADLVLNSPEAGGRRSAIPGAGVLRPMWDIGHRTSAGKPDLAIARIWVEFAPALEPGEQGTVRLAPLTPQRWQHLTPGDVVTMHEIALPIGMPKSSAFCRLRAVSEAREAEIRSTSRSVQRRARVNDPHRRSSIVRSPVSMSGNPVVD